MSAGDKVYHPLIPAAMYLTPSGLLHVERGQMDIYVAASMLTTLAPFRSGGRGWAIAIQTGVRSAVVVGSLTPLAVALCVPPPSPA